MRRPLWLCLAAVMLGSLCGLGCTGVVITDDRTVLVGINEDWFRSDAYYWASPAIAGLHGAVYFGYLVDGEFGDLPPFWFEFQGVNDAGLFFDSLSVPPAESSSAAEKRPFNGSIERLLMQSCSTVEEAVQLMAQLNIPMLEHAHYLLADRSGAAAIVEADCVTWMSDRTLAVTNFRLSDLSPEGRSCWRYDAVTEQISLNSDPSIERVAQILRVARVIPETRYSLVIDLRGDVANIYRNGDYSRQYQIELPQLWEAGSAQTPFSELVRVEH